MLEGRVAKARKPKQPPPKNVKRTVKKEALKT